MRIHLNASQELKGCYRKKDAWKQILDFKNYRHLIPEIETIRIHEENASRIRSEWFIMLDGAPFSWIEIATPLEEQYILQSEAMSGDFDTLKGKWNIADGPTEGIKVSYSLEYELGIPVIEENCRDILMAKMQHYIDSLVEKHCLHIGKRATEERRFKRFKLNRPCSFTIGGRTVEADILDVSRGGMRIHLSKGMFGTDPLRQTQLQFATIQSLGRFALDHGYRAHRIVFNEPLDQSQIYSLLSGCTGDAGLRDAVAIFDVVTSPANGVTHQITSLSAG